MAVHALRELQAPLVALERLDFCLRVHASRLSPASEQSVPKAPLRWSKVAQAQRELWVARVAPVPHERLAQEQASPLSHARERPV